MLFQDKGNGDFTFPTLIVDEGLPVAVAAGNHLIAAEMPRGATMGDGVFALLAAYYITDMNYPVLYKNFMSVMEFFCLGVKLQKPPHLVAAFVERLSKTAL